MVPGHLSNRTGCYLYAAQRNVEPDRKPKDGTPRAGCCYRISRVGQPGGHDAFSLSSSSSTRWQDAGGILRDGTWSPTGRGNALVGLPWPPDVKSRIPIKACDRSLRGKPHLSTSVDFTIALMTVIYSGRPRIRRHAPGPYPKASTALGVPPSARCSAAMARHGH